MQQWDGFYKIINPTEKTLSSMLRIDGEFRMVRGPVFEFYSGGEVVSASRPPHPYHKNEDRFADSERMIFPCGEKHFSELGLWNMAWNVLCRDNEKRSKEIVFIEREHGELVGINGKFSERKYAKISFENMVEKVAEFYRQGYFILCTERWKDTLQEQEVCPIESAVFMILDYSIPGVISVPGLEIPPMTIDNISQQIMMDLQEFKAYVERKKSDPFAPSWYAGIYDKIDYERNVIVSFPKNPWFTMETISNLRRNS